jgi:hypothetical protein
VPSVGEGAVSWCAPREGAAAWRLRAASSSPSLVSVRWATSADRARRLLARSVQQPPLTPPR